MKKNICIISAGDFAPLKSLNPSQEGVQQVWEKFISADIGIVNLELPLTNSNEKADKAITLKADPVIAKSMHQVGIDIVSLANNHACDFGSSGLEETINAVESENVYVIGAGKNINEAYKPVIQEINGMKIAHVALCSALPTGYAANENRPGIAPVRAKSQFYIDSMTLDEQPGMAPWVETRVVEDDLHFACEKMKEIKRDVDVVIAQVHWGIPNGWCAQFQGPLADYQQPMGRALIDAGVDIIMGHHPHAVHGIEKYNNGYIVYSLGSLLFHSMSEGHPTHLATKYPPYNVDSLETGEAREAVIMETQINADKQFSLKFYPTILNKFGEPEFLQGESAIRVLKRMQKHSKTLNTEMSLNGLIGEIE